MFPASQSLSEIMHSKRLVNIRRLRKDTKEITVANHSTSLLLRLLPEEIQLMVYEASLTDQYDPTIVSRSMRLLLT